MSDISHTDEPLGVVALLADSFSRFFSRFFLFIGIAVIPILLMNVIPHFLFPSVLDVVRNETATSIWQIYTTGFIIFTLLSLVISMLVSGVIILAAYDAALGNKIVIGSYVSRALAAFVPVFVLGIVYYIIVLLGAVLLIIPGLYLAARLFAFTPAILIEGAGFSGLS